MTDLYHEDVYAWAREQAEIVRARRLDALDRAHVAEELDDIADGIRSAVRTSLRRIVEYFLYLEYALTRQQRAGWMAMVIDHRQRIADRLDDSPSLRRELPALLERVWPGARALAAHMVSACDWQDPKRLPEACPYTLEQILEESWQPESRYDYEELDPLPF